MSDWRQLLTDPRPNLRRRLLRWGLRLGSLPYAAAMSARNKAYDWGWLQTTRTPLGVISVGNLSVGGTGKSPLVAWLARWLRTRDVRVAVLSRGYGELDSGRNDEALEFELQFPDVPHLQHPDRRASAQLAHEELEMQVLLLDDGFQHRRLGRDLDIVLLDATHPPAAQWLLPGGLMREPLASLSRADVVVLTRANQVAAEQLAQLQRQVRRSAPKATLVLAEHRAAGLWSCASCRQGVEALQGTKVLAFSAIGNPESFYRSLQELGAEVLDHRTWPDHHAFHTADLASLQAWSKDHSQADMVVCTMKDWVKIQESSLGDKPLCALQIDMAITGGLAEFEKQLESLLLKIEHPPANA